MKRYALSLFIIFSTAVAFAVPEPYVHSLSFSDNRKVFFRHLVDGQRTTYTVCAADDIEDKAKELRHMEGVFDYALNYWFDEIKKFINIRRGGRRDFQDILEVIENRKNIYKVPCQSNGNATGADLTVIVKNNLTNECGGSIACNDSWGSRTASPAGIHGRRRRAGRWSS